MTDAPSSDALTLLSYALDEMRETTNLLPVAAVSRSLHRPWWRNVFFGFARSKAEVSAGLSVQYLGENIDRARDHWRASLSALGDLQRAYAENEIVVLLGAELRAAGVDEILPRLQHDAIPQPIGKTAVHLESVVRMIRDCDRLVLDTRNKLTLQRMRNETT
jgi:hypothetical protein